jgi:hypothetical protein
MAESRGHRQFVRTTETWYHAASPRLIRDAVDETFVGVYHDEGGTSGEFAFRWYDLGAGVVGCRLEVFDDAWAVLVGDFPDLMSALPVQQGRNPTPADVTALLTRLGIVDATRREPPNGVIGHDARRVSDAAPDLLAALRSADAALRHHPGGDCRSMEDIARATAAIAKATGEATGV